MRAFIIGSGSFSENALQYLTPDTYIICADGGYDHAVSYGIVPDILLGDLDSVKTQTNVKTMVYPKEKNETDSELALNYAMDKGYTDIVMTGVTGTRLDHTLSNIFLLKTAYKRGVNAVITDEHNEIYYTEKTISLKGNKGEFFSVIPVGLNAVVSILNARYPIREEPLNFGESRGISNEFLNEECVITVHEGSAIIIKSKD